MKSNQFKILQELMGNKPWFTRARIYLTVELRVLRRVGLLKYIKGWF